MEEYRQLISLLNEKNLSTNIDDNTEKKFIFLYSKPPLPPDDDDVDNLSILSHLENEIE